MSAGCGCFYGVETQGNVPAFVDDVLLFLDNTRRMSSTKAHFMH